MDREREATGQVGFDSLKLGLELGQVGYDDPLKCDKTKMQCKKIDKRLGCEAVKL